MKKFKILISALSALLLCMVLCIAAMATETETTEETFDPNVTSAENTNFAWSLDTTEGSATKGTLTISYNNNDTQLFYDGRSSTGDDYTAYANFIAWKKVWNSSVTRIVVTGFSDNAVRVQSGISFFANWEELVSIRFELVDNKNTTWNFRNFWMSGGWFQNCPKLTTLSIGGTETAGVIDLSGWGRYYRDFKNMFKDCDVITTVILPEALTDMGAGGNYETAAGIHDYMFLGTSKLNSITIPSWAASIGTGAFSGNTSLESITIPGTVKSIGSSAFSSVTVSKVTYSACTALTNVTIENGVETIGSNAFKNCTALVGASFTVGDAAEDGTQTTATGLVIPASVTTISAGAFSGTGITAIKLMSADTAIEAGALPEGTVVYCSSSSQVEALTANGYNAVYYIETISSGSQIVTTDTGTGYSWALDTEGTLTFTLEGDDLNGANTYTNFKTWRAEIDNNLVKKIVVTGDSAYGKIQWHHYTHVLSNWPKLETIHLGSCVSRINNGWTGSGIFQNNNNLTAVYHENASEYDAEGNINLAGLTELTHDSSKNIIGSNMFSGCSSFSSITLPSFITTIASNAFNGCTNLTYIELPATVTSIGASAFSGSGIKEIKILGTDTANFSMDTTAFDDTSIIKAGVFSEEMKTLLVDTYGFTADNVSIILGGSFADNTFTWEIVSGVLTISGSGTALSFDEEITADTLSNIPWAAGSASIEKVIVKANITSVCDYAFAGLSNCKAIEIPASLTDFSASSVFSGDNALGSVYVTGFEPEDGVIDLFYASSISADLFDGCQINASVYLPKLTEFGFIDTWVTDLNTLTVVTYPTSTLATAIRARNDVKLAYLPESHDATLTRSGETTVGDIFYWTYDDATETLKVSGKLSVTKTNRDEWYAWRNIWADAIIHFRIDKAITSLYNNNGKIFKELKNLVSVHFETEENIYLRNFGYGFGYFNGCSSLTTISIGADDTVDGVIDLSRWTTSQHQFSSMFTGCTSITKVILPQTLKNINGSNAKIDTLISESMFKDCISLPEIVIPDCFVGIDAEGFNGCTALKKIVILNPEFDLSAATATTFPANENLTIYVTSESVKNDIDALGIANITVHNVGKAVSAEGFSIRMTDYNGLRGIFAFDNSENEAVTSLGLTLKEYGAIVCTAAEYDYWGGIELENVNGVYTPISSAMKKIRVYDGNQFTAKILNSENITNADPDKTYFALSVVRYTNNFKSDIYMSAYAVYTDAAGNDYYVYANYGETKSEYKFIDLYQMTIDMYKNDEKTGITSEKVDETAVWNTILQGALEGYSEIAATDAVTVTVVSDDSGNYAFVRNENGEAITEDDISSAVAGIAYDGTLISSFGVSIEDQGTEAPLDVVSTSLNTKVTTPNRYNRADDKAQHQQGMCTDGTHIYYSFTGKIVKVRMADEVEVGTVTVTDDINQFSGHMGNLIYHEGKIYGSLSFWGSDKTYIAVMNADDIVGDVTWDIMQAVYYTDENDITLFAGTENETADKMHGGGGIDSITVGKIPGGGFILADGSEIEDTDDYLVFGAGSAYQHPTKRHDDDYLRLRFVDFDDIAANATPLTAERIESAETPISSKYTAYAYAGATCVQCIAYDKDTGDYHFATYGRDSGLDDTYPNHDYFVIDGSQKLYLTELYLGQNTPESSEVYDISIERAAQYKDKADLDGDGITDEQMLGWTMNLKCLCGRGDILAHDAFDYDSSGYASRICGMHHPAMADNGLISMGNDYFYAAWSNNEKIDDVTYYGADAQLYRLRRYNGAWTFVSVS